ncbi:MAG: ROK family protein, partial [Candidatus Hydrogenedentes bacterium]|nr:ROK family protein [Candidatus Hydrogenedentota bacterium]
MNLVVAGIDLGGTNVKTAIVARNGDLLGQDSRPTHSEAGLDAVLDTMAESLDVALEHANVDPSALLAVGIGAPGPMNWRTGVVFSPPNLPGWEDVPLAELMRKRLNVPTYVDNDANVACWGEFWSGAGREVDSMVCVTLGTGVGGGIVVFGKLLRGPDGTAGEIGHMCVSRGGRQCNCGSRGCLEQYASATGLVHTAVEGIESGRKTMLMDMCGGDVERIDGKMISDALAKGDEFAGWVMRETGIWLGTAIGSLVNLLNPEMVVLCGGMIAAGDALFEPIRTTAFEQAFD